MYTLLINIQIDQWSFIIREHIQKTSEKNINRIK